MAEHCNKKEALQQNLEDAGCSEEVICRFYRCCKEGRNDEALRLLKNYRCNILESIHKDQRMLDSLDFLIYKLKRSEKNDL